MSGSTGGSATSSTGRLLLLPAGQEHRLRSVHLRQLRLADRATRSAATTAPSLRRRASCRPTTAGRIPCPAPSRSPSPATWRGHGARDLLRNVSVFSTFRYTSGTPTPSAASARTSRACSRPRPATLFPEGINTQRLPSFKQLDARLTKSFGLGRLDLTGYLDVRNLLNLKNILEVFAVNGDVQNDVERAANLQADLDDLATERDANDVGIPTRHGAARPPLRRAADPRTRLRRLDEQQAAACRGQLRLPDPGRGALRQRRPHLHRRRADQCDQRPVRRGRGEQEHTAPGRRARLGIEINF